jgi:probable HAF family extracellular repeat protein
MKDLGTLGGPNSQATGINNAGLICGDSQIRSRSTWHAFLYEGGAMKDLGGLGKGESHAKDVNDTGQVVGWSHVGSRPRAFLYTGGAMQPLGTLGGTESIANGINDAGQIVGLSLVKGTSIPHAFLWEKGAMVDLNSLIPADSGWLLRDAQRIADGGQIVGYGVLKNRVRPFLLTPNAGGTP